MPGNDKWASCLPSLSMNCSARCEVSPPCTGSTDHQPARSLAENEACAVADCPVAGCEMAHSDKAAATRPGNRREFAFIIQPSRTDLGPSIADSASGRRDATE